METGSLVVVTGQCIGPLMSLGEDKRVVVTGQCIGPLISLGEGKRVHTRPIQRRRK